MAWNTRSSLAAALGCVSLAMICGPASLAARGQHDGALPAGDDDTVVMQAPERAAAHVEVDARGFLPGEAVRVLLEPESGGEPWVIATLNADARGDVLLAALPVPAAVMSGRYMLTVQSLAGGTSSSTPTAITADYAQYRYGQAHTGFNPKESTLSAANVSGLRQLWSFKAGAAVRSSAAVVAGAAYFGSQDGKVYALDAVTGALRWSFTTGGAVDGSPAVDAGRVFIGSADTKLYALDAATGSVVWTFTAGGALPTSPTVAGGRVYVTGADSRLYCVNATTGKLIWSSSSGLPNSSPTVNWGKVFVTGSNVLVAYDAATGAVKWSTRQKYCWQSSPATGDNLVFVGLFRGVGAFDATTGRQVWAMSVGFRDQPTFGSPAYASGVVYQGYTAGVVAIDGATGNVLWDAKLGNTGGAVVANGVVYASSYSAGRVNDLAPASGTVLASQPVPRTPTGAARTDPAIANGTMILGSDTGDVIAYGL